MDIAASLSRLQEEIAAACAAAARDPGEITLVAISKTYPAAAIREAYSAGIRHFGENRVQELVAKRAELEELSLNWHMVGSLQTNKVRSLLPHIDLLHSLDRFELAEAVARLAPADRPLPALIQVNTTGEATKSGVAPDGLDPLVERVRGLTGITLCGFMTIGPLGGTEEEIRRAFASLRELRDRLAARHPDLPLPILSMGMSEDFALAIREGATHLRIGSRIFGARGTPTPP